MRNYKVHNKNKGLHGRIEQKGTMVEHPMRETDFWVFDSVSEGAAEVQVSLSPGHCCQVSDKMSVKNKSIVI